MKKGIFIFAALFLLASPVFPEETGPVVVLNLKGTIGPATARYVSRGLDEARQAHASAVVLQLNPSGAMDGSLRSIIQRMLNSPIPVIVYIASQKAPSAVHSAVSSVAQAAHLCGTAPGVTVSSEVQFFATDLGHLLEQADGRQVKTVFGVTTLSVKGNQPKRVLPMSFIESALHALTHPTVAYVLLLLGIYGLIFELSRPGAVFPGVAGAVLFVLALIALETLQANWGIVALSALAAAIPFFLLVTRTGGVEGLIGAIGVAKTDLAPEGLVHVKGEEWQGRSREQVAQGTRVRVVKLEGLTVHVEPVKS